MRPPPAHRATTAHLQAVYPFVSDESLGQAGPLIGRDLLSGPFRFDPWELYRTGRITNPNVIVLGQLGRGKSSFVKTLVWRQLAFGRRAWILDPKGEYGPLARACGTEPIALAPGGATRGQPSGSARPQTHRVGPGRTQGGAGRLPRRRFPRSSPGARGARGRRDGGPAGLHPG